MHTISRRTVIRSLFGAAVVAGTGTILSGGGASRAVAREPEIYTGLLSNTGAGGYDVVAYHTQSAAVKGSSDYVTEWKGAKWRFSSAENRDLFAANPERYAPAYGGHCAWAVSQGYTAKGDPKHWNVVDNRLYLNFNADIKQRWEGDIPGHIASGDRNWPGIIGQ